MLLVIPLLLSSTGYALFTQQLSVHTNATSPVYTSSQNLSISYTRSVAAASGKWRHTLVVTIKNNNTKATTAWRSAFSIPSDFSSLTCTNATCTQSGGSNVAVDTGTNGAIAAGGTTSYTFSFLTATQTYRFTTVDISGTLAVVYSSVSGLTVTASAGTRTKSGKWYTWPYTFTVTNASGQNLDGWRIQAPWSTSKNQVASMPATVNYVEAATQLTIMSTLAIDNGTSFQFVADLSSTSSGYVLSGYTVQGQF